MSATKMHRSDEYLTSALFLFLARNQCHFCRRQAAIFEYNMFMSMRRQNVADKRRYCERPIDGAQ